MRMSRQPRRLYFGIVAGLLLANAADAQDVPAGSQEANPKVVIVSLAACCKDEAWVEAESLVKTELSTLDIEVDIFDGSAVTENDLKDELMSISEERDAIGALRIMRSSSGDGEGINVWIFNRSTGKAITREIPVDKENEYAALIAALQVVELFRASLFEANGEGGGQEGGSSNTSSINDNKQDTEKKPKPSGNTSGRWKQTVGVRIGMEALGSPGSVGALGAINMGIRWNFLPYLAVELDGLVTLLGEDIKHEYASASFDIALVRAWLLWRLYNKSIFRSCMGVGTGVIIAWSEGSAPEGYITRAERQEAAYIGGTLQVALVPYRYIWIRLGFTAGTTLPRINVKFWGESIATFGMPLLEGFLNLEFRFP